MRSRKYIALVYDEGTHQKLREYCSRYGFDLSKGYGGQNIDPLSFEFHTTIFYTTSRHNLPEQKIEFECDVIPLGFEMLGENKEVPVLQVEHPRLRQLRKTFEDVYKMKDTWDGYKPHLSLSYNWSGDEIIAPLPDFKLKTKYLEIKDVV